MPTSNSADGKVVPIPTLPPVKNAEKVALEKVGVPVNVLAAVPLCVYPPLVVIPVVAVIAPAVLTVNVLLPTANNELGTQVPIPTFPLVTSRAPCVMAVVPIPTFPLLVSYTLLPDIVHPLTPPGDDQVVSPELSVAVNINPLVGL